MKEESKKYKFKLKVPNTYLLIFSLLVLIAIMTWIIPGGEYERTTMNGREVVVQNSFKQFCTKQISCKIILITA